MYCVTFLLVWSYMNGNNKIQSWKELRNTLIDSKLMYETIRV